jgi:hypothetical protein
LDIWRIRERISYREKVWDQLELKMERWRGRSQPLSVWRVDREPRDTGLLAAFCTTNVEDLVSLSRSAVEEGMGSYLHDCSSFVVLDVADPF